MKLQGDSVGDLHTPALDPNPLNQSQVQIGQDPLDAIVNPYDPNRSYIGV